MNVTIQELYDIFPLPVQIEKIEAPYGLPNYMGRRTMFSIKLDMIEFISIVLNEKEQFNIETLKKQLSRYSDSFNKNCAFIIVNPTNNQLSSFLKNLVPFITNTKQIFLPFMGIKLENIQKKEKTIKTDYMMPATQQLFLYMFYNADKKFFLKSEIAQKLRLSKTSLTRSSEQLIKMKLITQEKSGRDFPMTLLGKDIELYNKAKDYLINPISEEFYINKEKLTKEYLMAGETALAENSMLVPPRIPCYAVYKNDKTIEQLEKIDIRWDNVSSPAKIQLWKYPPELFANTNCVDTISLICSFKNTYDERIESEIENILRTKKW